MRSVIATGIVAVLLAGCAAQKGSQPAKPKASPPVLTADLRPVGTVVLVNNNAKFVVIKYPPGPVPQPDHRLAVYHKGLKTAELKVTGPARESNTVADILDGQAEVNDEVREQ